LLQSPRGGVSSFGIPTFPPSRAVCNLCAQELYSIVLRKLAFVGSWYGMDGSCMMPT